jgi:hypothetical protein
MKPVVWPWAVAIGLVVSVNAGSAARASAAVTDYSGTYYTAVGHEPRYMMAIEQSGTAVEFSLEGKGMYIEGSGTVAGVTLNLTADLGGGAVLSGAITFAGDGGSFQGNWEVTGTSTPSSGTLTGTTEPWPTYDPEVSGLPKLAVAGCIELEKVQQVSKFRSGEGHDFADDFESCRSMKHYYMAKEGIERSSVKLFSPFAGTVIGSIDDWDGALWKGTAVGIRSAQYPAFLVIIFHIDLDTPLSPGAEIAAGQLLGTSEKQTGTTCDVAVGVNTPYGYRLVSLFEVMTDEMFARYQKRGVAARSDFIVPQETRDADPLSCDGEEFSYRGSLENWVTLREETPFRLRRRLRLVGP